MSDNAHPGRVHEGAPVDDQYVFDLEWALCCVPLGQLVTWSQSHNMDADHLSRLSVTRNRAYESLWRRAAASQPNNNTGSVEKNVGQDYGT